MSVHVSVAVVVRPVRVVRVDVIVIVQPAVRVIVGVSVSAPRDDLTRDRARTDRRRSRSPRSA